MRKPPPELTKQLGSGSGTWTCGKTFAREVMGRTALAGRVGCGYHGAGQPGRSGLAGRVAEW
eukprot:3227277-Heterocapsa_arctica.AAC.1